MNYKKVNFCEFDPFASKSYCAIHNVDESINLGDITKVDETVIEDFDLMTWGSPCQDFSVAGKGKGSVWTCKECGHEYNPLEVHYSERDKCPHCGSIELDKSRSSLLVEGLRVVRGKRPKFSIYENVKNIVGKQFKSTFDLFTSELEEYGYNNYYKVLDGQNYGIPQHRERVFVVSVRKDLDNGKFEFPKSLKEIYPMTAVLDEVVDDKYSILQRKKEQLVKNVNYEIDMNKQVIGTCHPTNDMTHCMRDKVYNANFVAPTLTATMYKDPPKIIRRKLQDFFEDDAKLPMLHNIYGGFGETKARIFNEVSPTIRTSAGGGHLPSVCTTDKSKVQKIIDEYEIRTITPLEAWRLMGFSDEDFNKAKEIGISNTQLYKQAGNSIIVNVPYYILLELYNAMPYLFNDLKISSFFSGIGAFEKALDGVYEYINNQQIAVN